MYCYWSMYYRFQATGDKNGTSIYVLTKACRNVSDGWVVKPVNVRSFHTFMEHKFNYVPIDLIDTVCTLWIVCILTLIELINEVLEFFPNKAIAS